MAAYTPHKAIMHACMALAAPFYILYFFLNHIALMIEVK